MTDNTTSTTAVGVTSNCQSSVALHHHHQQQQQQLQLEHLKIQQHESTFPYYPPLDASTVSASLRPIGDSNGIVINVKLCSFDL
jgi:hypothetical protein